MQENLFQDIYSEVMTPCPYGVVLRPSGRDGDCDGEAVDCPTVFTYGGRFYMTFVAYDGSGYHNGLAVSDDLLSWEKLGFILNKGPESSWDSCNAGGYPICDHSWGQIPTLHDADGKYAMLYIGSNLPGYEAGEISVGLALAGDPLSAWTRAFDHPVMRPTFPYEGVKLWKQFALYHEGRYYDFYNAGSGPERICAAFSDDLVRWERYPGNPLIGLSEHDGSPWGRHISGDPYVVRIGDVWVMFYFTDSPGGFIDSFALSEDLLHWEKSHIPLTERSHGYDETYAHKPCIFRHNGIVYHYYCATGNEGRVIALSTSADPRR